jgi:hypothetical protein
VVVVDVLVVVVGAVVVVVVGGGLPCPGGLGGFAATETKPSISVSTSRCRRM